MIDSEKVVQQDPVAMRAEGTGPLTGSGRVVVYSGFIDADLFHNPPCWALKRDSAAEKAVSEAVELQPPAHEFLDIAAFSSLSGLSPSTIRRRIKEGDLKGRQPGGPGTKILIPLDALERAAGPVTSNPSPAAPEKATPRRLPGRRPAWKRLSDSAPSQKPKEL